MHIFLQFTQNIVLCDTLFLSSRESQWISEHHEKCSVKGSHMDFFGACIFQRSFQRTWIYYCAPYTL